MPRLFTALEIPADIKEEISRFFYGIPGTRFLEEEQLHVTLTFIGDADGGLKKDILEVLSQLRLPAFNVALTGAGVFPPRGPAKILWLGVQAPELLAKLKKSMDASLDTLGVELEKRKFKPHLTIARMKNPHPELLAQFLSAHHSFTSREWKVGEFSLYESKLRTEGAEYYLEGSFPLGEGNNH